MGDSASASNCNMGFINSLNFGITYDFVEHYKDNYFYLYKTTFNTK